MGTVNLERLATMYGVTATVETRDGEYTGMRQIPTFFLDEDVQGIVSEEGAVKVALNILSAIGTNGATFHITAVKL